jgi:hypothetical protein
VALWFVLRVGDERLGGVEVRRQERLDLRDRSAIADVVSTYQVHRDEVLVGEVRHRYGAGAWQLLAAVAALLAEKEGCSDE